MKNEKDDTFNLSEAIKGFEAKFNKNAKNLSNEQIANWLEELNDRRNGITNCPYPDELILDQTIGAFRMDKFGETITMATPIQISKWLKELYDFRFCYPIIEYYGSEGTKDNVNEYKKLCKELAKERKKNKSEESNVECLIIDKITELISKMKLVDVRKLKLFE